MAKGSIDPTARNAPTGKIITPEQIAAGGSEHAHQAAFFQWIALYGSKMMGATDLLFAIPNGGDRKASVAASLKAEGVKSGVPDVCWPNPSWDPSKMACVFAGLWIELKRPELFGKKSDGRSERQVEWHQRLRAQGYAVVLAYGWQAMAWATWLYSTNDLRMKDEDALVASPVDEPPRG